MYFKRNIYRTIAGLLFLSLLLTSCTMNPRKEAAVKSIEASIRLQTSEEDESDVPIGSFYTKNREIVSVEEVTESTEAEELPSVDLVMVGDMLMHLRVTQSGEMEDGSYNYDHFFTHVKEDITSADIALVNQEVILGGSSLGYSGYPIFNSAFEVADALENAGFDVCLSATNHAMDKGKKGLENCMGYWKEECSNVEVLGIHDTEEDSQEIYVYEQDGIEIAILNYTYGLNGMPLPVDMPYAVDVLSETKVTKDVTRAKELADFVIVCPHWGTEYQTTASTAQKQWADLFLSLGVDLVIGTHPHVIEPVEWLEDEEGNRMLVYYSLGNFINSTASEGSGVAKRVVGGMAKVKIGRTEAGSVEVIEYGVQPLVTQIIGGKGLITTYRLDQYNQELAETNEIRRRDGAFSYQYCLDLCEEVFADLSDGEMKQVSFD